MAYIGKTPTVGNFQVCDAISVVNGQAAYTLQVGGVNVAPESANHMLVSLNGILQKPGSSFTISGSTMTFASNLATGDVIDFVQILGNVLDIGQPSDDTVTAAKLNNDIISGQTALTSEPDDTDEFLVSDAGTIKRIDYSLIKGGGVTEADSWRITANFTTQTGYMTANWERNDTYGYGKLGTGMSESSGVFSFPSTGHYLILFNGYMDDTYTSSYAGIQLELTQDNSSYDVVEANYGHTTSNSQHVNCQIMYHADITNVSTHKVRFRVNAADSVRFSGSSTDNNTSVKFIKLADT